MGVESERRTEFGTSERQSSYLPFSTSRSVPVILARKANLTGPYQYDAQNKDTSGAAGLVTFSHRNRDKQLQRTQIQHGCPDLLNSTRDMLCKRIVSLREGGHRPSRSLTGWLGHGWRTGGESGIQFRQLTEDEFDEIRAELEPMIDAEAQKRRETRKGQED
ncbi:hypothetical protein BC629DRAFT_1729138 [Irpex lacteus]|nr:hypothetical protein BC629DRAFT_1729138 [Irpex lacteus]